MKKIWPFLALLLSFHVRTAHSLIFEPGGALVLGDFSQSFTDIIGDDFTSDQITVSGNVVGLEINSKFYLQYHLLTKLNFGVDISSSVLSLKPTIFTFDGTKVPSYSAIKYDAGLMLGLSPESRWLPHLWFSYFPLSGMALSEGTISNTYIGNGLKFGVGFGQKIRFNIEYKTTKYNQRDGSDLPVRYKYEGFKLTEQYLKVNEVLLGVSFPVDILNK